MTTWIVHKQETLMRPTLSCIAGCSFRVAILHTQSTHHKSAVFLGALSQFFSACQQRAKIHTQAWEILEIEASLLEKLLEVLLLADCWDFLPSPFPISSLISSSFFAKPLQELLCLAMQWGSDDSRTPQFEIVITIEAASQRSQTHNRGHHRNPWILFTSFVKIQMIAFTYSFTAILMVERKKKNRLPHLLSCYCDRSHWLAWNYTG